MGFRRIPNPKLLNYEELHLNPNEVVATEELLFRYAQRSALATEIDLLSSGQEVQKNSSIKNLIPIWDEENQLLKHNSRITTPSFYLRTILLQNFSSRTYTKGLDTVDRV